MKHIVIAAFVLFAVAAAIELYFSKEHLAATKDRYRFEIEEQRRHNLVVEQETERHNKEAQADHRRWQESVLKDRAPCP